MFCVRVATPSDHANRVCYCRVEHPSESCATSILRGHRGGMEFDEEFAPHADHMALPEGPLPEPNRFLIVCLSTPQTPREY